MVRRRSYFVLKERGGMFGSPGGAARCAARLWNGMQWLGGFRLASDNSRSLLEYCTKYGAIQRSSSSRSMSYRRIKSYSTVLYLTILTVRAHVRIHPSQGGRTGTGTATRRIRYFRWDSIHSQSISQTSHNIISHPRRPINTNAFSPAQLSHHNSRVPPRTYPSAMAPLDSLTAHQTSTGLQC